jgi:hypothetical protein
MLFQHNAADMAAVSSCIPRHSDIRGILHSEDVSSAPEAPTMHALLKECGASSSVLLLLGRTNECSVLPRRHWLDLLIGGAL